MYSYPSSQGLSRFEVHCHVLPTHSPMNFSLILAQSSQTFFYFLKRPTDNARTGETGKHDDQSPFRSKGVVNNNIKNSLIIGKQAYTTGIAFQFGGKIFSQAYQGEVTDAP